MDKVLCTVLVLCVVYFAPPLAGALLIGAGVWLLLYFFWWSLKTTLILLGRLLSLLPPSLEDR